VAQPHDNAALALFTQALLNVYPDLETGVPEDKDLNSTCLIVFERWVNSLGSYRDNDLLTLGVDRYHGNMQTSDSQSQLDSLCLMLTFEMPCAFYLKPFVNAMLPYELVSDTLATLNELACSSIEIWTPDLIREHYSYVHWYGAVTDEEFIEEFEAMGEETFNPEEHEALLPSAWTDHMAQAGYIPSDLRAGLKLFQLASFDGGNASQAELVSALLAVKQLLGLPRQHSSQQENFDLTNAAFVFLWDDSSFLPDALDEFVNYRFECGESTDEQTIVEYTASTELVVIEEDIRFIERQVAIRMATGRLMDAMSSFCPLPPST
jgi:hypothetical protein